MKTATAKLEFRMKGKNEHLSAAAFVAATRTFLALLADIEEAVAERSEKGIAWMVSDLHPGSATITIEADAKETLPYRPDKVAKTLVEGIRTFETEAIRPYLFSDSAVRYTYQLASMASRDAGEMSVSTDGLHALILPNSITTTKALLGAPVEEWGEVEGALKMVTVAGNPRCNIYDSVTGMAVTWRFGQENLRQIAEAIGKRVSISGLIVYTRDGYPSRVKDVTEFAVLPEDDEMPTAKGVLAAGLDLTGGLSTQDFLEKRRNVRA